VAEGDYVRLDVYEEVSNVVSTPQSLNNPLGPTTTIRSASTTVMVQDHRTAVIGGLLSNQSTIQRSAVPFISDIPVIGNLFSDNGSNKQKLNLLVFLTPHVIRTRQDLRSLALDERKKFVEALGRREMHQMPIDQYKQLYQPTFSVPVSPEQDLNGGTSAAPPPTSSGGFGSMPSSVVAPPPSSSSSSPLNTEVIGPSSKSTIRSGARSMTASAAAATTEAATTSSAPAAVGPASAGASGATGFGAPSPLAASKAAAPSAVGP